ncbi:hypothetical protein LDC_0301, partial [sediment metagenome]
MIHPTSFVRTIAARARHGRALIALTALPTALVSLLPAFAAAVFAHAGTTWALAAGAVAPVLMAARGATRQLLAHRARVAFYSHVSQAIARRSALDPNRAASHRLEGILFTSEFNAARLVSDELPTLLGSAVAAVLLVPILFAMVPWQIVVVGAPAAIAAVAGFWAVKRLLRRHDESLHDRAQAVSDAASSMLRGHADLLASARADRHAAELQRLAESYSFSIMRAQRAGALTGRVPLLAAGAVAALIAWSWLSANPDALGSRVVAGLALAAVLPVAAGLARSASG